MMNARYLSKTTAHCLFAMFLPVISTPSVAAAFSYEQAAIDGGDAYLAYTTTQTVADDFTVNGPINLQKLTWWGSYVDDSDNDDEFSIDIYDTQNSASPLFNATLASGASGLTETATTKLDIAGTKIYQYELVLQPSWNLVNGTYYLSIANQLIDWYWLVGEPGNNIFWNTSNPSSWQATTTQENLAFRLDGESLNQIPEPNMLTSLFTGIGIMSVFTGLRLRKKTS